MPLPAGSITTRGHVRIGGLAVEGRVASLAELSEVGGITPRLVEINVADVVVVTSAGRTLENVFGQVIRRHGVRDGIAGASGVEIPVRVGRVGVAAAVWAVAVDAFQTDRVGERSAGRRRRRSQRVAVSVEVRRGIVHIQCAGFPTESRSCSAIGLKNVRCKRLIVVTGQAESIRLIAEQIFVRTRPTDRRESSGAIGVVSMLL